MKRMVPDDREVTMNKPNALTGAVLALFLAAPLLVVLSLAHLLLGTPFVAFDLFDVLTRLLPGGVLTAGIDLMVGALRALGLSVADTAKLAEQAIATFLTLVLAALGGAWFFATRPDGRPRWWAGLLPGLLAGVPLALVTATRERSSWLDGLWSFGAVVLWGLALAWSQRGLIVQEQTAAASAERIDRRQFMVRVGGAAALITVAGAGVGATLGGRRGSVASSAPPGRAWSARNALPNANAALQPAPGTRPEFTPVKQHYRIDINLAPPVIEESSWRLHVRGMVDSPRAVTLSELRSYAPIHQFITLACISNPVGGDLTSTTRWTGVPLQRLLVDWGVRPEATHLRIVAADGFFESVAIDRVRGDERIMLAYAWDGQPLPVKHGFPLRIFIPDVYGMKQPKWIDSIEAVGAWEPGYWVVRGWDKEARMRTTSVIDTVATDAIVTNGDGAKLIPIGGIAHAGARGIRSVEVRVDDGDWQPAELRQPLSELTWVVWRFDWPFEAGVHTFTVRCTDGTRELQSADVNPPHPSGATGLDRARARVS